MRATELCGANVAEANSMETLFASARAAQSKWALVPLRQRMAAVGRIRHLIAERAEELAASAGGPPEEALAAQVLPLADACRFLVKRGAASLATKRLGWRGRPVWLAGVRTEISREPWGVVLIIAPSNYPLLLPGVQALQALAAGNAVMLKPAGTGIAAARALGNLVEQVGIDHRLLCVLPADVLAARVALTLPIDKVIFTGSSEVGQRVLEMSARRGIPAVAELSGCDAVFIRDDADLALATEALLFGLRWNGSATCIAPRRVFVARRLAERLEAGLCSALEFQDPAPVDPRQRERLRPLIREALQQGASALLGGPDVRGGLNFPCVLTGVTPTMRVMKVDCFAPLLCLLAVDSDDEALELAAQCPLALGASVFSRDETAAQALAARVRGGAVTINDLIVPTADPRVPFGGRGGSGYGVTRGAEGLLELTAPKVIQLRRGRYRPHFEATQATDAAMFRSWIVAAHGRGVAERWRGLVGLVREGWRRATAKTL